MRRQHFAWSFLPFLGLTLVATVSPADTPKRAAKPEAAPASYREAESLIARIDEHIAAKWKARNVREAAPCDDAEFLRRVYLDITGRIPRYADVRDFLEDQSPDKRQRVVDKLLDSGAYVQNMSRIWRVLLIPPTNEDQGRGLGLQLEFWLRKQFRENVPYDRWVREIITAQAVMAQPNPEAPAPPPAAPSPIAFFQANELKPENLAAATSRLFLGVKLECAQCHDHPFAKLTRKQFWSLAAFYSGLKPQKLQDGVFTPPSEEPGQKEIEIPGLNETVEATYLDGTQPQWREGVATRATLAEWLTRPDNPYFTRAIANRLWAHFFGVGLIDPVEEPWDDNPASHPELLNDLARELAAHQFDLKYLVRAIVLSKAYQLTSRVTDESQIDPQLFARMSTKGLTAEQFFDSLAQATGYREEDQERRGRPSARAEFVARFSNNADKRTETSTSILQALALMNGKFIDDHTSLDRSQVLAATLNFPPLDTARKIEILYMMTLSRKPTSGELAKKVEYVNKGGPRGDPGRALGDVFWALLNSGEFMLNH